MTLIIYWLTLMVILPLDYLFWWKKTWRLILGIIILAVFITGWILPGKIAFSILERELKQVEEKVEKEGWAERGKEEERRSWKKLGEALKNTLQQAITAENQEKISLEKEIIKWREEYEKVRKEEDDKEKPNERLSRMRISHEKSKEKEWE